MSVELNHGQTSPLMSGSPDFSSLLAKLLSRSPHQPATCLWRAAEMLAVIKHASPLLHACRHMLDIGCGDGETMRLLKPHLRDDVRITGLDPDERETALASKSCVYDEVLTSGAESIDLPDDSVDGVFSNSVLEHISSINEVLGECARVLNAGGLFVATVPSPDFHNALRGPLFPWRSREDYLNELDTRLRHIRYWTASEWSENLAQVGIKLETATPYLSCAEARRWEILSNLTGGLLYSLTGKSASPLNIQHKIGIRGRARIPLPLATMFSKSLSTGMGWHGELAPYGCLLLIGRRK